MAFSQYSERADHSRQHQTENALGVAMRGDVPGAIGLVAMVTLSTPALGQAYPFTLFGSSNVIANTRGNAPVRPYYTVPNPRETRQLTSNEVTEVLRWGHVGKCVAAADHDGSLSFVAARRGSTQADAAAKRLDPAFASCLTGSGVASPKNKMFRRAAVADALGVKS